jgi:two-component system phosphate regulon response regulator PhoB
MPKVLLVEDDVTMVSLLKTLLKMEGFRVVDAQADDDIPAAVRDERPDVLLMDVHLFNRNGLEIIDSIRREPDICNVSVVMTSGMNLQEECLKHGATAFLMKPFMPDDLIRTIKTAMKPL